LMCGSALAVIWTGARTWGDGERFQTDCRLVQRSAAVFLTGLASVAGVAGRTLGVFGLFEILSLTLIAMVATHGCSSARNFSTLRSSLFVGLFFQSALIVVEQTLNVEISLARGVSPSYVWAGSDEGRFAGTFGAPSCAATFLVVCLLFLFRYLASKQQRGKRSSILWGLFAFGLLGLLLTRTRSGWIGFVIGCSGMSWQCYREGALSRRMVKRFLFGGLVALSVAWPLVALRLAEDHVSAANLRWNLVWIAVEMIKAHPLVGVGLNTATNQVYAYAARAGLDVGWVFAVHNQFLLVAAETGILGLVALLSLVWTGLRSARQCARAGDPLIKEAGSAVFWSLVAMCWALSLDHVSGTVTYALFWFLIGAACGLNILRQRIEVLSPRAAAG